MAERVAEHLADADIAHVGASPLERAQETAQPIADAHDLPIAVDGRLIEADNVFEGLTFGVGDGALTRPRHWKHLRNPFRPSWGEPYRAQALRMLGAMATARDAARGHEAVLVSHQLPIWITRTHVEGRRLWHDPRKRECSLASLTSFTYRGRRHRRRHLQRARPRPAAGVGEEAEVRGLTCALSGALRGRHRRWCASCSLAARADALVDGDVESGDGQGFVSGDGSALVIDIGDRDRGPGGRRHHARRRRAGAGRLRR